MTLSFGTGYFSLTTGSGLRWPQRRSAHLRKTGLEFSQALDTINVWRWRSEYPKPGILDGTQWSLDIDYPDRSVHAHGDNNYPGPQGMPTGQPEEPGTLQSFVAAVSRLLGKEPSE